MYSLWQIRNGTGEAARHCGKQREIAGGGAKRREAARNCGRRRETARGGEKLNGFTVRLDMC